MKRQPKDRNYVKKYMDKQTKPATHADKTKYARKEKYKNVVEPEDDAWDDYEDVLEHGSKAEMRHFMEYIDDEQD
jgi:hypothetical protein